MHTATPQVIAALNHVRTFLPEVTQVFYTVEQKWLYMTDEGKRLRSGTWVSIPLCSKMPPIALRASR